MSITKAIAQASEEIGAVRKADRNEHQRFNFRGIDAVVNACHPVLTRYGIVIVPEVREHHYTQLEVGKNRTLSGHCRLLVAVHFCLGEERVTAVVASEAMDSGDKAYPKAMSVALRTALLQTLCLPTDEPDPDHDTYERAPARGREQQPEPPVDLDAITARVSVADLAQLRDVWAEFHKQPVWSEIEPLIEDRRAQLAAT